MRISVSVDIFFGLIVDRLFLATDHNIEINMIGQCKFKGRLVSENVLCLKYVSSVFGKRQASDRRIQSNLFTAVVGIGDTCDPGFVCPRDHCAVSNGTITAVKNTACGVSCGSEKNVIGCTDLVVIRIFLGKDRTADGRCRFVYDTSNKNIYVGIILIIDL